MHIRTIHSSPDQEETWMKGLMKARDAYIGFEQVC